MYYSEILIEVSLIFTSRIQGNDRSVDRSIAICAFNRECCLWTKKKLPYNTSIEYFYKLMYYIKDKWRVGYYTDLWEKRVYHMRLTNTHIYIFKHSRWEHPQIDSRCTCEEEVDRHYLRRSIVPVESRAKRTGPL